MGWHRLGIKKIFSFRFFFENIPAALTSKTVCRVFTESLKRNIPHHPLGCKWKRRSIFFFCGYVASQRVYKKHFFHNYTPANHACGKKNWSWASGKWSVILSLLIKKKWLLGSLSLNQIIEELRSRGCSRGPLEKKKIYKRKLLRQFRLRFGSFFFSHQGLLYFFSCVFCRCRDFGRGWGLLLYISESEDKKSVGEGETILCFWEREK